MERGCFFRCFFAEYNGDHGAFYRHVNTRRFGRDHPFSGWLIRNALLLQQSFAAIFAQLRDTLWSADISQERMSYEASVNRVTTINEALARMAEIDPTIGARDVSVRASAVVTSSVSQIEYKSFLGSDLRV